MPLLIKKILNWIMVAVSGLIAVFGVARFGSVSIDVFPPGIERVGFLLGVALVTFVPLLAFVLALLNRRRLSALLFLLVVPIFPWWAVSHSYDFPEHHIAVGVCLGVVGLYWLFASWRDWPAMLPSPLSLRRRIGVFCLVVFLVGALDLVATFILAARPFPSSSWVCAGPSEFPRSTFGHDAIFTAHAIRVGHQLRTSDGWLGYWALATVQERYRGWHFPRIVLLTEGIIRSGHDYFVDARRPKGLLTRFLPIMEIENCTRTSELADAGLALRLLRSGLPENGARIIGQVRRVVFDTRPLWVQGATVAITGPIGTIIAVTDREGIYDIGGLPPGRYRAQLQERGDDNGWTDLAPGQVAEFSFALH
ncbi:MAG TPA: carboxypeptidase-like regulatory domain-containing protein [Candidatus Angelobacter sp.]|jgi:hypothetical protein|nr:carboxypeptidase-like regulatory domain-containing protein [Candidatus Angelobacter sp.]